MNHVTYLLVSRTTHQRFTLPLYYLPQRLQQTLSLTHVRYLQQQLLQHLVLTVRKTTVVRTNLLSQQSQLLLIVSLHLVSLQHSRKVLVKHLTVKFILTPQSVTEKNTHRVHWHQVLLKYLTQTRLKQLEHHRIVVLHCDIRHLGEQLSRNDLLYSHLLLRLHLQHLSHNWNALLLNRFLPGRIQINQKFNKLQETVQISSHRISSLNQLHSHWSVL